MQRIPIGLLMAAASALAQGNHIQDGRSAWNLSYGLGPAQTVTAHTLGLAYSAKGLFDFGFNYALMDYDSNPMGLGNAWGLNASLHFKKGSGDNPFGMSLQASYAHLDAGENDYDDPFQYEDRPNSNSGTLGLGLHKGMRLGGTMDLHFESGFHYHFPEPDLGGTAGFGIDAFIPFEADLSIRFHEKAKLILGAWYSLYLLDLKSSSKGIGIGIMLFPLASPTGAR